MENEDFFPPSNSNRTIYLESYLEGKKLGQFTTRGKDAVEKNKMEPTPFCWDRPVHSNRQKRLKIRCVRDFAFTKTIDSDKYSLFFLLCFYRISLLVCKGAHR